METTLYKTCHHSAPLQGVDTGPVEAWTSRGRFWWMMLDTISFAFHNGMWFWEFPVEQQETIYKKLMVLLILSHISQCSMMFHVFWGQSNFNIRSTDLLKIHGDQSLRSRSSHQKSWSRKHVWGHRPRSPSPRETPVSQSWVLNVRVKLSFEMFCLVWNDVWNPHQRF